MSEIVISALDHVTSLCTHLIKDKQALSTEFNIGLEDVMILNNIEIGSGDCHNCGSSVSRVIFENGAILIYKPKNLKIAKWFGDLSKELFTGMNKDIQLKYPVRLLREKYTWEEFISEKPCKKEEDIRLFYNRVGVLIQLAQATRCQDLHGENIIASGSYPIPIDLEAIASPLPKVIKKNFKWLDSIITSYFQSPLCLGILPTLEIKSNGDVFYDTTFPSKHRDAVRSHICLPMLNGKAEFIENYVEEIIDGYISARKAMEINFKNDNGRLFNFKDYLIRFIPRNTSLYAKILKETSAKHPKTFIDSELLYEIAMYSSPITEKYLIAIIDQEIWALSHGDIPFFTSQPGSKSISSNNNIPIHVGFVPIDLNLFVSNLLITNPLKLDVFLIRTAIGVLNFPT
jgi:lantibiotic modifying enzyme